MSESMKAHWEQVYASKSSEAVSWYQPHAALSLELIRNCGLGPAAPIIDVGGGASTLVDDLLAAGHSDLTVLDLSANALAAARRRLGEAAARVHWIEADVTAAGLPRGRFAIWHDRAVFHFMTTPAQRAAYVATVRHAVRPGGYVIVASFAEDGPPRCSGLPVSRYAPQQLHAEFGAGFLLLGHREEGHHTPAGAVQQFVYCLCRMGVAGGAEG